MFTLKPRRIKQPNGSGVKANLARYPKLKSLLLPSNKAGRMTDVLRPRTFVYSSITSEVRPGRRLSSSNATTGTGYITATGICSTQKFSRIAIIYVNLLAVASTISDSRNTSNTGGAQWVIGTGGEISLNKANVIGIGASSGIGIAVGGSYVVGVTYDGTTAKFFRDGRSYGSGASSQTFDIDASGALFTRGDLASEQFNGEIFLHADFDGALPDTEMRSLTLNPWQLFAGQPEYSFVLAAASGQGVLSGDGVATSSLTGSSTSSQPASGTGVATSSIVGSSRAEGVLSGTGVATSSIVGDSSAAGQGVLSGAGVATSSIVGSSSFIPTGDQGGGWEYTHIGRPLTREQLRKRLKLEEIEAEVVEDQAALITNELFVSEQQQKRVIRQALKLQGIELEIKHLEALNAVRQAMIDAEIAVLMKKAALISQIDSDNEEILNLLFVAVAA